MSNKARKERKREGSKFVHSQKIKNSAYKPKNHVSDGGRGYIDPVAMMEYMREVNPWSNGPLNPNRF